MSLAPGVFGSSSSRKTRLAAELAVQAAGTVWWVDLSAAEDSEAVLS